MASQVLGLVFLACMDALRDDSGSPPGNMKKALIMSAGLSMPIMIATALYNSPNRRLDFEERNKGSY